MVTTTWLVMVMVSSSIALPVPVWTFHFFIMPVQDHPLSSSTRRRATSITSRASVVSFDSHHGSHHHSVLPPVHSPRDRLGSGLHEGYFDARRTSHDSTRRPRDGSMSTAPSKSPLLGSSADITSARGRHLTRQARVDATELSGLLGMGPARSPIRLPRALIGIGRQEHALVTTRFEVMGEEEMKGYFEGSGSRRTSEVHSPVKGITYSEQASNPTSLPSTSTTSTHTSAPSPNPSTPDLATDAARFESPTTPRPRTFRRTTTLLAHPLPSPAIDIPLFPPSPPASNEIVPTISREGPQEKNARKSIDSTGEIGGREREALRILSRIVRELIDVCVGLEEENDALKSQAIEGKDVSRGGIIESRIDGRGDGESVLETKISGANDADVVSNNTRASELMGSSDVLSHSRRHRYDPYTIPWPKQYRHRSMLLIWTMQCPFHLIMSAISPPRLCHRKNQNCNDHDAPAH